MRTSFRVVLLVVAISTNFVGSEFNIPELSIRAFKPRGVTVSFVHTPGDHSFAFHGNINKPIPPSHPGEISGDTSKKQKGKWVIHNSSVSLKLGDTIHYWMFVSNDVIGYRTSGIYQITSLEVDETANSATSILCLQPSQTICERVVVNITQKLFDLQQEVATLRENNGILKELVQKDSNLSRTLFLDGLVVSDNELKSMVQAVITEKMFVEVDVDNVVRGDKGKIKFQVDSIDQKLEIIKAAKRKLKHSRFVITY